VVELISGKALGSVKESTSAPALALSPDGRLVAVWGYPRERQVVLREVTSGKVVHTLADVGPVSVVAFSPDGQTIAVTEGRGFISDDAVHLFDVTTGKRQRTIRGHAGLIAGVTFSPDGKRLATGGWDSTVLVWDLTTKP
jgi:WD40 repeat protein